jgi:hypothetical protein
MILDAIRPSLLTRIFVVLALVAMMLTGSDTPADAATSTLEVSTSCVAIGQDVSQVAVWGSGFDAWLVYGPLTVQWSWGGNVDPATVSPPSRQVSTGSFSLVFDVRGLSQGGGGFDVIAGSSSPTLVGLVNVAINRSCPTGSGTCTLAGNQPALAVQVQGYTLPPQWGYAFYYQYHLPDQVGPVEGGPGLDGAAHGTFVGLAQNAVSPTVTARIVEPANGDVSAKTFFVTFAVPVCRATPTTTTTSPTTRPTTTSSTSPPTTVAPRLPSLTVNPKVGSDGTVAVVTGAGFPANVNVAVLWHRGLGAVTAHTDSTGAFIVTMLVFPHDLGGPRTVAALGFPSATAAFLVEAGPAGPPGIGGGRWLFRSNSAG